MICRGEIQAQEQVAKSPTCSLPQQTDGFVADEAGLMSTNMIVRLSKEHSCKTLADLKIFPDKPV
jgi:hypothetical protein